MRKENMRMNRKVQKTANMVDTPGIGEESRNCALLALLNFSCTEGGISSKSIAKYICVPPVLICPRAAVMTGETGGSGSAKSTSQKTNIEMHMQMCRQELVLASMPVYIAKKKKQTRNLWQSVDAYMTRGSVWRLR